jgi:hypothetical protein
VSHEGLEVADVFRRFGPAFRERHGASLSVARWRAMTAIETCRTAALGGHVESCGDCGHQRVSYNSCRNRNCPKCQGLARAQWLEDRQAELLDVPYFHVVFTVPDLIATIAFQNQTVVYDILFRAASETLRTIAADPAHLGAEIGFLGVLHSWGQNLLHHPHIHFLVPGGGIAPNGKSWIACRPAPLCQRSCRLDRTGTLGARIAESGSIRTSVQRSDSGEIVAAGEFGDRLGVT